MQSRTSEPAPRRGVSGGKYAYLQRFRTRHGKVKVYFRRKGCVRVPMPDVPIGSPDWDRAYALALAGGSLQPVIKDESHIRDRTWNAAIAGYKAKSPEWINARENTRKSIRYQLGWISRFMGDDPVEDITTEELETIIDEKAIDTPGAARMLLRGFRAALWYARKQKWRLDDPTAGIHKPRPKKDDGYLVWTDTAVAQYRAQHQIGTVARLAFEILINTGMRRDDAIHVGYKDRDAEGFVTIEPRKTKGKRPGRPILAVFPIEPELAEALAATPTGINTWLVAPTTGRPFTNDQFGRLFRQWCVEAGIGKEFSAHGLRKKCFTLLGLRHGYTGHEIMAWSGHTDLKMVQKYTDQYQALLMTKAAITRRRPA